MHPCKQRLAPVAMKSVRIVMSHGDPLCDLQEVWE